MATYPSESKSDQVSSSVSPDPELSTASSTNNASSLLDLELVDPSLRTDVQRFLQTTVVSSEEGLPQEIKKAESWLEWAGSLKYLKLARTDIPDFILPKNYSGELIDVKVFCKHGPDDKIYDSYKMVRDKVARGNCFLHLKKGPYKGPRCILHALKKFTGGLGDDDDKDRGDNIAWRNYFLKQKKRMIKSARQPPAPARDDYHTMDRPEQVIILRLRTGHNRLHSHMYTKFLIGQSAMFTFGMAPETTDHVLQDCLKYNTSKQNFWPRETPVKTKLYEPLSELKKTVKFIQETALQI